MCGIAGVMYFDGRQAEGDTIQRMTQLIAHRGPDDTACHLDGPIGLGFRRLSIIDLEEGRQPCSNEDGSLWLVFNGEIYNYKELRALLTDKGHTFASQSDSETIVHLYEEYGERCVEYLRGMFAFTIWDSRNKTIFAARDHFGIKPYYYVLNKQVFAFASEMKALLSTNHVSRLINRESLVAYLTFQYVPQPNTMLEEISQLKAGHWMRVRMDGVSEVRRYWAPTFEPTNRSLADYVEEIQETLHDSVQLHMQSDVPRGCFLSSGIDSTSIATYMNSFESISTFSVGFEGPNNETGIAKATAESLGTFHYDHIISEQDYFSSVRKAVWHQDDPVADPAAIALYQVARLAKEHVTVVLSGEGADELFGGYRIYQEPNALRPLAWIPADWKRELLQTIKGVSWGFYGKNYLLRAFTPLEQRFFGNANIFQEDVKHEILKDWEKWYAHLRKSSDITGEFYDATRAQDPITRMQLIDMNLWLTGDILMKADKMTMAHSLELRVPFLDKSVFDVARKIPIQYRLAGGTTKYAFRKAMEGIIPDFVVNRPKLGFPVPLREWLKSRERMGIIRDQLSTPAMNSYFNRPYIERLIQDHLDGVADHSRKLWVLYIFSVWHETFIQS